MEGNFGPICYANHYQILFFLYYGYIFILAYLLGSIPFGLILAKIFGYGDIRKIGSGNIGSTNVLRTGNKKLAIATLILDTSKGIMALFLGMYIFAYVSPDLAHNFNLPIQANYQYCENFPVYCETCGSSPTYELLIPHMVLLISFFAILGHCFPIWLKFKGGKGVATGLGVLLVAVPYAGLTACAAWIATAKITKYSSLSALIAFLIAPIVTLFIYGASPAAICALITLLIWIRHKDNIKRLAKGEESKIGQKNKPHPEEDASEPVSK